MTQNFQNASHEGTAEQVGCENLPNSTMEGRISEPAKCSKYPAFPSDQMQLSSFREKITVKIREDKSRQS